LVYITFICQERLNCWPEILGFRASSTPFYKISFSFSSINPDFVEKCINKINVKKATGIDGISP
jgi:hypothetical protein